MFHFNKIKRLIFVPVVLFGILSVGFGIWYYNMGSNRHYDYLVPEHELIIGNEGGVNRMTKRVIELAFSDFDIIYTNDKKPHLIVRSTNEPEDKVLPWNAPYILFSGERYGLKKNRPNGPPFAEIITTTPTESNQFYVPFILSRNIDWSNIRKFKGGQRPHFLAYINSNCKAVRERFFKKVQKLNPTAKALGACSNPTGQKAKGSWHDLASIYKDFRFGIAMENHNVPGYITEKIVNVYEGGAIPIFWGDSEKVKEWFNPDSYIDLNDFDSFDEAVTYIKTLEENPEKIKSMLRAPIFKNNKVPEIFKFYSKTPPKSVVEAAKYIRRAYLEEVNTLSKDITNT